MTEGGIEQYDTFNTKRFLYELHFGGFHDQPIPPDCYDLLNDNDDYNNNIPGTPVDNFFSLKKGVEDAVMQDAPDSDANDKDIYDNKIIGDDNSLTSDIYPLRA